MGFRIESYTRDELRRVALPGKVVSTLFWVVPVGRWPIGELDRWWKHFTEHRGICNDLGLLLVRDHQAANRSRLSNQEQSGAATDLGRLADLVPEIAARQSSDYSIESRHRSVLVLSGAYPQPGWGVLVSLDQESGAHDFERLLERTLHQSSSDEDLRPILDAAGAYHTKSILGSSRPQLPALPSMLDELRRTIGKVENVLRIEPSGNFFDRHAELLRLREVRFKELLGAEMEIPESVWKDFGEQTKAVKEELKWRNCDTAGDLATQALRFEKCEGQEVGALLRSLSEGEAAFLKAFRFFRKMVPGLQPQQTKEWFSTDFKPQLLKSLSDVFAPRRTALEEKIAALQSAYDRECREFEHRLPSWERDVREAETNYRRHLAQASAAQWRLGPKFLMVLESFAHDQNMRAVSVAWDPARMVGWKLHVADLGIRPSHLLVAANSALGTATIPIDQPTGAGDFDGSLFADYAYYVTISAQRTTPWESTRRVLCELLNPSQFTQLLGLGREPSPGATKLKLAEDLLRRWGWKERPGNPARSLAACIGPEENSPAVSILKKSLNETRISLEGFLKDLVSVCFSTLGWDARDLDDNIRIHCPSYRRSTQGAWTTEIEKLTSGPAIVLLSSLFELAFPSEAIASTENGFIQTARALSLELNAGSHDPPPPPPDAEQLRKYASMIQTLIRVVGHAIGEMPWHLCAAQAYGNSPTIVTGHAWSHSHVEERLIRVMLWAGESPSPELIVWNRKLTNPVMTDAVVLSGK